MKIDIYMSESLRRVITVGPNGLPPDDTLYTLVDTQYHPAVAPHTDNNGWEGNHTPWHHVRNALYRRGYQDPSKWAITHHGDGMPNLPVPPETLPDGVFSFISKEIVQSAESPSLTVPAGKTSAVVGLVLTGVVVGGLRYAAARDFTNVRVYFGEQRLTRIDHRNNAYGQSIQFFKGDNLPATGTIKVEMVQVAGQDPCMLGPFMSQASFVEDTFDFLSVNHATSLSNRALSAAVLGAPAQQFWAACCRPRWNTGPFMPGTQDMSMDSYTVEVSEIIKGGTLDKQPGLIYHDAPERSGGKLEYDPATGIYTIIRMYDAGHPTIGFNIKMDQGDYGYWEIIEATPADFTTQESGTDNVSLHVGYYQASTLSNQRDTARVRRVITESSPTHLSYIRPSDSNARPNRDAFIIFVRGLQIGRHIKMRYIRDGIAMRAAMGKTKVAFNTSQRVNVSIADWAVLEEDDKNMALMAIGGTNIPKSDVPV